MRFSLGQLDVAKKVGKGYFFTFGDGFFGDKENGIVPFISFGGETGFTSTLCQVETFVGGGGLPSRFLRAGPESVERGFGTCNGVNHSGSIGNDGVWLIVASVSSWVPMCRWGGHLGSGRGLNLGSDGVHTLGRYEGSFPIS